MGVSIQRRRGTTSQTATFTGKLGEITVDTTKTTLVVHDGVTAGGVPLAHQVHTHPDATESTDGFMSAADKTKLDSIASGTISYQTIQSVSTPEPQRAALNFTTNFAVADDSAGNRTSIDLSDSGVGAGTYTKITVNTKGRVTNATLLSSSDIPLLTSSFITDFNTQVRTNTLDTLAAPASDINLNTHHITNLEDPVNPQDAATKNYVDATAVGLTFKSPCRVASTANVSISSPGSTIDVVNLNPGDRVLLKNQSDATTNGIYVFNSAITPLTRSLDANENSEVKSGMFVLITEGNINADTGYVLATTGTIILGTTNLNFVQFSSSGSMTAGNGISIVGTTVSVKTVSSTRIAVGSSGVDLATISGLTPGTYQQFTVDAYGRIVATPLTTSGSLWQVSDPGLTNITTISTGGTNGFLARTSVGNWAARTFQPGTAITLTNPDGVSGNPIIAVTPDSVKEQILVSLGGTSVATRSQLNFIQGTNATLTVADNPGSNRVDVTVAATGGGGGAPSSSEYVTLATDAGLSNERVLVAGTGINLVDGGSGNNVTLSLVTDLGTVP